MCGEPVQKQITRCIFNQCLRTQFFNFGGFIGPYGAERLVVCKDRMDTSSYIAVLQNNLLQSTEKMFGDEENHFIFQHDNATLYRANITKNFLR